MRIRSDETVAVRLTPPGVGGVAVFVLTGPEAVVRVRRHVPRMKPAVPVFGRIGDEVLVHQIRRGILGGSCVEVSCHGGEGAFRVLLKALKVREATWGQALDCAFRAGRIDRTRVEALLALPEVRTLRAAQMLTDQAEGALKEARSRKALLQTAAIGRALVDPHRIVLAGPPNSGKSTLFNALVGEDRVLVSERPHATRDPVEASVIIDGMPFLFVDTAGLSGSGGRLEAIAMARTREAVGQASLVLVLTEAGKTGEPSSTGWIRRPVLSVRTKTDLAPASRHRLGVCAPAGTGLDRLRRAITDALGLDCGFPRGTPVLFTGRQRRIVDRGGPGWRHSLLWGRSS